MGCHASLSRQHRDRHPNRALRRRLFRSIAQQIPELDLDGMAADDGHNSQLPNFACPSFPLWEVDFEAHTIWVFPPEDLIGAVLRFLHNRRRKKLVTRVILCLPERRSASWFWLLQYFRRVSRFVAGSDLFRERALHGNWCRLPPTKEPWLILASY